MARDGLGLQWKAQWRWPDSVCRNCRQLLDTLKQRIKPGRQTQPHIACLNKLQIHILLHFTNHKLVLQCQNRRGGAPRFSGWHGSLWPHWLRRACVHPTFARGCSYRDWCKIRRVFTWLVIGGEWVDHVFSMASQFAKYREWGEFAASVWHPKA